MRMNASLRSTIRHDALLSTGEKLFSQSARAFIAPIPSNVLASSIHVILRDFSGD
jgi:hypothetical protein